VVLALVVRLRLCPPPVALPVLFRLWRGEGAASQPQSAVQMVKQLAGAFPGRVAHGTGDAAFHSKFLVIRGTTWTTRLSMKAVLYGPPSPATPPSRSSSAAAAAPGTQPRSHPGPPTCEPRCAMN
jgi:hypothetical protein